MTPMSDRETATTAMQHWVAGAADGDWSQLLSMLDTDVHFQVPVEGFIGGRRGIAEATRFFDHLAEVLRAQLQVTSTLQDGARVAFEIAVRGVWLQRHFRQALCLVFVVGDGRVLAFHEYLAWPGGLDLG